MTFWTTFDGSQRKSATVRLVLMNSWPNLPQRSAPRTPLASAWAVYSSCLADDLTCGERLPHKVDSQLVTADNPMGSVSISDLELTATVAQSDVLCQLVDVSGRTTHTVHDNMATVWWRTKGSTTTTGPEAYLLRLQAIHQRHHRYLP
jgi:hypothetical protein